MTGLRKWGTAENGREHQFGNGARKQPLENGSPLDVGFRERTPKRSP